MLDGGQPPDRAAVAVVDLAVVAPPPDLALPALGPDLATPDLWQSIRDRCFPNLGDPQKGLPDYDQFGAVVGSHCGGTNHQTIDKIEKLVFLGDSITAGTPPTLPNQYYSLLVADGLKKKFGSGLEVKSCAQFGAHVDDLLGGQDQIARCFSPPEQKRTLVVMTVGGNDLHAIAKKAQGGETLTQSLARADQSVTDMSAVLHGFRDDPSRFPAGVSVVFANVYEYTDGEGDPTSCPGAYLDGLTKDWPEGRQVLLRIEEGFGRLAVETKTDMILLEETFCGHGFHAGDSTNECYRGSGAKTWFDLTCIHPTPEGHQQIAELFLKVVDE